MPRDTEADRMMRARKLQRERQEETTRNVESERARRALEDRMRDYNQQIAAEISTVLQILEQHDYPYLEELEVRERARWFDSLLGYRVEGVGEYRRRQYLKAAWRIGTLEFTKYYHGDSVTVTAQLYLLSDGRIYSDRSQAVYGIDTQMWSPREGRNFSLDTETIARTVLSGLGELRRKLEGLNK